MNSPVRRVLGDKDKNAHLNISSPKKTALDAVPNVTSSPRKPSNMASHSSPQAGIKRKIAEVEDAERVEEGNNDSQRTQLLSDSEMDVTYVDSSTSNMQQSYDTAATSFSASQNPLEQHFELQQEEMSQRTLDKLNEVPMPQNNSQLPPLKPTFFRDTSAGSVGLSSFVNFEGPPSSQLSDKIQPVEGSAPKSIPKSTSLPAIPSSEASARKQMLMEKAAELQTRLQLALYKVQTRQTNMPFSRLKVPKPTRARSSSPPTNWMPVVSTPRLSSSTIREPSSVRTVGPGARAHEDSARQAEAKVAAARSAAANQVKPPVRNLNSLPVPQFDPSLAGSTRKAGSNKTSENGSHESQQFPSSPPLSRQPSTTSEEHLLPGQADRQPETQISSPPASENGHHDGDEHSKNVSVSRGEAASGLVQLLTSGI